jgi:4-alpha-glucanotransferase
VNQRQSSKSSGILLHPTSLPGSYGIGDFGDEAHAFVDFLVAGGQSWWQVLPLGPTGYGDSPYQLLSAFAGNPLLIDPRQLIVDDLLNLEDIRAPNFSAERVEFERVQDFKDRLLRQAFENVKRGAAKHLAADFEAFCDGNKFWLDDYALFRALKDAHGGRQWTKWDPGLANRKPLALEKARGELREQIERHKFYQFLFFKQWQAVSDYCHARGVRLIGDIPIFVAHDSVDVWANREYFKLDQQGERTVVAGVPPDYFSETGQLWGNPLYDWERLQADGSKWWIERVRFALARFDLVRVDHFRGFVACWEVPAGEMTAEHGEWVNTPGRELFTALTAALGDLPIIAENLGVITPDVESLRAEFGFPGMRVLQFAFGSDDENIHLPDNYPRDVVAYTGTHDNDTTVGWFAGLDDKSETPDAKKTERAYCLEYLQSDGHEIHWDMIRAALSSVADRAIIPLQDVLGLGSEARMNLPASESGNWTWRVKPGMMTSDAAARLRELTEACGRTWIA